MFMVFEFTYKYFFNKHMFLFKEFDFITKNRVIGFTFFGNMFILPEDPYGRIGPFLSDILNKR